MKTVLKIFLLTLLLKAIYVLAAIVFSKSAPEPIVLRSAQDVFSIFKRNDAYWYEKIATEGEHKITREQLGKCEEGNIQQSYYAFFPLYPAILGVTMKLTGLSFNVIAFIYSILFSFLLYYTFYKLATLYQIIVTKESEKHSSTFYCTLVFMCFPFNYYFAVYQTEALYLLLFILSLICIHNNKITFFCLAASLLVIVRPNGLFMLLPLFIYYFERIILLNGFKKTKPLSEYLQSTLFFLIPLFVFIIYCIYLKIMTGDFFAYKTAQAGWCRQTVMPWTPILRGKGGYDIFKTVYLLVTLFFLFRLKKYFSISSFTFGLLTLFMPLIADSITSPRFIATLFFFPLLFGQVFFDSHKFLKYGFVFIFITLQLITFRYWVLGHEFSY